MANREAFHTPGICGFVPGRGYRKRSPLQKVYCIWDKSSVMENELQYDPLEGPKSEEWLTIDQTERIRLGMTITAMRVFGCRMKSCTRCCTSRSRAKLATTYRCKALHNA